MTNLLVGLDSRGIIDMIAQRLKENQKRKKIYDSAYRRAYYAVNKDLIMERREELKRYYEELESRFTIILKENERLRSEIEVYKKAIAEKENRKN